MAMVIAPTEAETQLEWYALDGVPRFEECPRCGGFTYIQDDLWGKSAGEYLLQCLAPACSFRFVGLVV